MRYRDIRAARKQPAEHQALSQENAGAEFMRHLNTLDKTYRLAHVSAPVVRLIER